MLATSKTFAGDTTTWYVWLNDFSEEVNEEQASYLQVSQLLSWYKKQLETKIRNSCDQSGDIEKNWDAYFKLERNIEKAGLEHKRNLSKIRYARGVEMIKMLYEKILSLDHHFAALQTHQNVEMLTNPNHYPAFRETREILAKQRKNNLPELPPILESNPYLSVASIILDAFGPSKRLEEDQKKIEHISCIMDFTLEMQQDLKTIYYDTEFLKTGLLALKMECEHLFSEYTAVIGYSTSLEDCRSADDWETIRQLTERFTERLSAEILNNSIQGRKRLYSMQSDLDFSIDRLLNFISDYNTFISQGEKYYAKFQTILDNYRNTEVCVEYLPHSFEALTKDIQSSLNKFEAAYDIAELKGSRLKEVMYGRID